MLVSYDKEGNWGGIIPSLSNKNSNIEIPESVLTFFNDLKELDFNTFSESKIPFLDWANDAGIADESFKKFLQTTAESGTVYNTSAEALKGYESFLQSSGRSAAIAATKTKALSFAMKAVSSVGWMMLITGVTKLVGTGFKALDKYVLNRDKYEAEALEKMSEKAQDAQSKIKSLQSEIKQNADTVDQAGKKYAELAQGVNQLTGKNISLSDDEYKEFLDVSNQLAEVFPQLTKGYDDNGNAILDLQGNVDGITGKLKDLLEIKQQLAQQEVNKKESLCKILLSF